MLDGHLFSADSSCAIKARLAGFPPLHHAASNRFVVLVLINPSRSPYRSFNPINLNFISLNLQILVDKPASWQYKAPRFPVLWLQFSSSLDQKCSALAWHLRGAVFS